MVVKAIPHEDQVPQRDVVLVVMELSSPKIGRVKALIRNKNGAWRSHRASYRHITTIRTNMLSKIQRDAALMIPKKKPSKQELRQVRLHNS